jgi:hypothetical protein
MPSFSDYAPPPKPYPDHTSWDVIGLQKPSGKSNQKDKVVYVCKWSDESPLSLASKPHEINCNVNIDMVALLEIICKNPACKGCGAVGRKYPQYCARGPGGVAIV